MTLMKVMSHNARHRRLAELVEAFDLHEQAGREAEAAGRQTEAILVYRALLDIKEDLCDEALRVGLPLSCMGGFADDLDMIRSFVAGYGWH